MAKIKEFKGTIDEYRELGKEWKKIHGSLTGFTEKHGFINKSKIKNYKGQGLDDWVGLRNSKDNKKYGVKPAPRKPLAAKQRADMLKKIQPEVELSAKQLEATGLIKKGKADAVIKQFEAQLKLDHRRAGVDRNKAAERWGYKADIGHGTDVKAGGQNIYANLAPEPAVSNQTKQNKKSRPPSDLMEANVPAGKHSQLDAFWTWLINNEGDEYMTTDMKTRLLHTLEDPGLIEADARNLGMGGTTQRAQNVDLDSFASGDSEQYLRKAADNMSEVGARSAKAGLFKTGANKLSTADAYGQLLMAVQTGNVLQGGVAAASLALQDEGVQRKAAKFGMDMVHTASKNPKIQKQIAEIMAKRTAKSAAKLIPGVDVGLSAMEAWGYLAEGKLDQAGIAALSGAVGWIPIGGDAAAAALDLTNTGLDIARLDPNQKSGVKSDERPEFEGNKAKRYNTPDANAGSLRRQINQLSRL